MATYTWSIPSGKEITGNTFIKDTDNYLGDTIDDLVAFVNSTGSHSGEGLTYDLVDKLSTQTISGSKTFTSPIIATGGITGDITGDTTGNADTATTLVGLTSTISELNILDGVTADKDEINILDGLTASTAELNILDGVTSTTEELNILDGVTADKDEINILDGATVTTEELNKLDGVTATSAEINYLDGVTSNLQDQVDTVSVAATQIFIAKDRQTSGVHGGTFDSGERKSRSINYIETNTIVGASLASNKITLPAGDYIVNASAPANGVTRHQAWLYDTTGTADLVTGSNQKINSEISSDESTTESRISGAFTLSEESVVEIQHRSSSSQSSYGFGYANGWGYEVYSQIEIRKMG